MKFLLITASVAGLLLTLVPSFLVFAGTITMELNQHLMLAGTFLWFVTAPAWMNKDNQDGV